MKKNFHNNKKWKIIIYVSLSLSLLFLIWLICLFYLLKSIFSDGNLWPQFFIFVSSIFILPFATLIIRINLDMYFNSLKLLAKKNRVSSWKVSDSQQEIFIESSDKNKKSNPKSLLPSSKKTRSQTKSNSLKEKELKNR
jgi:hypothetical protein